MFLRTNLFLISLSLLSANFALASGPEKWPQRWVEEDLPDGSIKRTLYVTVPGMGEIVGSELKIKNSATVTQTESSSNQKSTKTFIMSTKGKK